ncbi:hypothetical protein PV325_012050, partial [Microctonus aethiopoides]
MRCIMWLVEAVVVGAAVCGRIPGLAKSQREQCKKMPHAMPAVSEGAELGLRECRHQFRHHRWNCSHVANDRVFGHVVVIDLLTSSLSVISTLLALLSLSLSSYSNGDELVVGGDK